MIWDDIRRENKIMDVARCAWLDLDLLEKVYIYTYEAGKYTTLCYAIICLLFYLGSVLTAYVI